jgi:hypothetical protein
VDSKSVSVLRALRSEIISGMLLKLTAVVAPEGVA